ncbi:proteasome component M29 [Puttea exsequens]|nr:proteasome component M29 [Puttea exsequens]
MSTKPESPEAKELSLVGKVEMRIAMAADDAALEKLLTTYLSPLLLKLASEYVSVRNKVISVCQHVNTRIKPPLIRLPVAALLKQYKDNRNNLVRHFDLLYIQQGIARLPVRERLDLLPTLLHGLQSNYRESDTHAATLFNLLLKLLHSMTFPPRGTKDDLELRDKLNLTDRADDVAFLITWLGKLLLFGINQPGATRCPGLSKADCDFLQLHGKKDAWTSTAPGGLNLVETKVVAARFLASGTFTDSERFLPALFASADSNSRISDIGDDVLKRATSAVSLEDPQLIERLYGIYIGSRDAEGSLPVRVPLQTKILALLCRSKLASVYVPQSIQIIEEALTLHDTSQPNGNAPLPKQGLEASKLRSQVFAFTNWLARISSSADLSAFAPALVKQLQTYIESQGWPRLEPEAPAPTPGELASRAYAYESIGLLIGACPSKLLRENDLELLRWLLLSLSEDPTGNDVSSSIEQALSSVLGAAHGDILKDLGSKLESLLLYQMNLRPGFSEEDNTQIVRSTRYIAVRFANRCLPFSNTSARWIDVLAMDGDVNERSAIVEEGRKGLEPYWYKMLNPASDEDLANNELKESATIAKYDLPSFEKLIGKFFGTDSPWDIAGNASVPMANTYMAALTFCRCVLLHQALLAVHKAPIIDAEWERNIDALVTNDEEARDQLRRNFTNVTQFSSDNEAAPRLFKTYLQASLHGMVSHTGGDTGRAGDFFLELSSFIPNNAYISLSSNIRTLEAPIFSNNKRLRGTAAHTFGLLASFEESPKATVQQMVGVFVDKSQAWRDAIGSEVLNIHGAILALAYFLSRSQARHTFTAQYNDVRQVFVGTILAILKESRDSLLQEAVFDTISELSLFGVLSPENLAVPYSPESVLQILMKKAKDGQEKAIIALGHFAIQCGEEKSEESLLSSITKGLYELHTIRQAEVQFAVGDALCCSAIGWRSKSLVSVSNIQGYSPEAPTRTTTLSSVLDRVLSDCKTTKPALRQASVIWLLCLVQYCGHLESVQSRLRDCQIAFKGFLADRESLNQESASRGLTLVYEKGNRALKDDLIRDLVGSFTGTSTGLAGNVSEDTELFDTGALPTGEGNSVTTYKDIMSLAAEVGDSSLVYRFMSLASNNAIWSSRAAFGRFGLTNILSDASTDGYLAQNQKLYPALFRYRFDPNTNVRDSMNDIWTALVKEPTKTIDANFDCIMDDLLKNILTKEWRVRQASCAAIADLVQGRPLEKYEKYLTEIWELTFKVCDDIKESVRSAAMALARVLTGILTRGLEASESSSQSADKMLKQVLPFLLSPSGLESGAADVQEFARKTLLKIIKSSNGKILRPFIPDLIGRLLALLSSIEPEMINYLHLNADKYGITAQELDDARLKQIRGSSMLEAIERCLDFLDESSMHELQSNLENAIKTVVGLPSKVGCSRVLVSLSTRQNFIFKPYADHFLPLARKQVFDRNETISSSYAAACGYLSRLASDEALLKLIEACSKLYFDSDDDRHRVIAGDIIYAISKYATDRFNSLGGEVLPFVFVAKHDTYERAKSLFEDTWNENVGGSRTVLLYLKEIVALASQYLDSARWSVKHTSAFAVADAVSSCGSSIHDTNAKILWPALERSLSGKTWEGKETILKALITFTKNSQFWSAHPIVAEQIEKIVIRESKRNNPAFRQHALGCLGDFVELRASCDMYPQVYGITKPIIEEILDGQDKMDVDSQSGGASSKAVEELTVTNASAALLKSINPQASSRKELSRTLSQTLELVDRVRAAAASRTTLNAMYDAQKSLFERLDKVTEEEKMDEPLVDVLIKYVHEIFRSADLVEQTRQKAAEAAMAMAPLARKEEKVKAAFLRDFLPAREQERSYSIQQSLDQAKKMLG